MAEKFKIPVEKGKTYTIDILRLGSNGEGVGRVENFTVFIDGALPGETVTARICPRCRKGNRTPYKTSPYTSRYNLLFHLPSLLS